MVTLVSSRRHDANLDMFYRTLPEYNPDMVYQEVLRNVLAKGVWSDNRTGIRTLSLTGQVARYNASSDFFPLLSTKTVSFHNIKTELAWLLSGNTNVKYMQDRNVKIWDAWADEKGELGPVYGKQWRDFGGVDQIKNAIHLLMSDPTSRRNIVSAWNPVDVPSMALPPCHSFFQLVAKKYDDQIQEDDASAIASMYYKVDLILYQRSADMFLGVPYNVASYALLLSLLCQSANVQNNVTARNTRVLPGEFIHVMGDCHIYENHIDAVKTQLSRDPTTNRAPTLAIPHGYDEAHREQYIQLKDLSDSFLEQIYVNNYYPRGVIKAEVAV